MAQVSIRVEPLSREDVKKASAHNARELDELHVDATRTAFNQCLFGTNDIVADVENILVKYDKPQSKVVCCEVVATASADYFDSISPNWRMGPSFFSDELKNWIKLNKEAFIKKYGVNRLASMHLHLDEQAPHFHIFIVPVSKYEISTGRGAKTKKMVTRVMYSKMFGDTQQVLDKARKEKNSELTKLGRMQSWYAEAMKPTGLERGIKNSQATHEEIKEYRQRLKVTGNMPETLQDALPKCQEYDRIKTENDRLKTELIDKDKVIKDLAPEVKAIPLQKVLTTLGCTQSHKTPGDWLTPGGLVKVKDQHFEVVEMDKKGQGAIELVIALCKTRYENALRFLATKFKIDDIKAAVVARALEHADKINKDETINSNITIPILTTKLVEQPLNSKEVKHSKIVKNDQEHDHDRGMTL